MMPNIQRKKQAIHCGPLFVDMYICSIWINFNYVNKFQKQYGDDFD